LRKENKLVYLRCLGYITAKFHQNIPSGCWDRFASSDTPPNSVYQVIQLYRSSAFKDQSLRNLLHS